jgi:hypothetical protein
MVALVQLLRHEYVEAGTVWPPDADRAGPTSQTARQPHLARCRCYRPGSKQAGHPGRGRNVDRKSRSVRSWIAKLGHDGSGADDHRDEAQVQPSDHQTTVRRCDRSLPWCHGSSTGQCPPALGRQRPEPVQHPQLQPSRDSSGWQPGLEGRGKAGNPGGPRVGGDNNAAIRGSEKEELMKRAILGVSAAAAIALAPVCIPPAQAHADDPCVSITDPAAHQACIDESRRNDPMHLHPGECQSSPRWGAEGQFCRNFWLRKSNRGGAIEASASSQLATARSSSFRPVRRLQGCAPREAESRWSYR